MSADQKEEGPIKIDSTKITIRVVKADDDKTLTACNDVIRWGFRGFGKVFHHPDNCGVTNRYCNEVYVAEYEKEIIGCVFLNHYGSIRMLGPLCILPKYWKNGAGTLLMNKIGVEKENWVSCGNNKIKRDCLLTGVKTFQYKFYSDYGFKARFLVYMCAFDIKNDYKKSESKNEDNKEDMSLFRINDENLKKHDIKLETFFSQLVQLCNEQYPGLDGSNEVKGYLDSKDYIGSIMALYSKKELMGYCCCKYSGNDNSADRKKNWWIRFGIAKNLKCLEIMVSKLVDCCKSNDVTSIRTGIDTGRIETFDIMTRKFGWKFNPEEPTIHMGRVVNGDDKPFDDFNRNGSCILGDFRA